MDTTDTLNDSAESVSKADAAEIERAMGLVLAPGQVTELRALEAVLPGDHRPMTYSGYFNDPAKLAAAAAQIISSEGIYFVPNKVKPALLARSVNKARPVTEEPTTSDADIVRRRWLLIDCDPLRPAGSAAAGDEHGAAQAFAADIDAWLAELHRWPAPIYGVSGNGAHLLYRIDMPSNDGGLVERCLKALAHQFDDERIKVDTSVHNPAQIWRLYGCPNGKGDAVAAASGCPRRVARILHRPDELVEVPREQLEALAALAPQGTAMTVSPAAQQASQPIHLDELGWQARKDKLTVSGRERGEQTLTTPVLVNLAHVIPREVRWLWKDRFPLGKLTLVAGEPGLGKSFMTMDLTARVTTGTSWPDDPSGFNPAGSVVVMSAEDDLEDTVVPRLLAAGADLRFVTALQGIEYCVAAGPAKRRSFNLECDLPSLEKAIDAQPDCRLVVIDPVTAFTGGKDSHKNAEIRGLLAPLADLAARRGVAVVAVTHLNKAAGSKAMHRVTGSLAFIAAARAGWLVTSDKNDPKRRLLLPIKNNLAEDVSGLAYSIIDGVLAWESGPVSLTADDALSDVPRKDGRTERDDAADWLRELLTDGAMPQKDVAEEATANGIGNSMLRRAKCKLGVRVRKRGFQKDACWIWELPGNAYRQDTEEAQAPDVDAFSTFDATERPRTDVPSLSTNRLATAC